MEKALTLLLVGSIIFAYMIVSEGVVVYNFYNWFVYYTFPHATTITFGEAVGLTFVIGLFKNGGVAHSYELKQGDEKTIEMVLYLFSPWLTLIMGAIVHAIIS